MRKKIFYLLLLYFLAISSIFALSPSKSITELAPGITYIQQITDKPKALIINVLKINLKVPGIFFQTALAGNDVIFQQNASLGRETLKTLVDKKDAFAGINGDYFPYSGDPLGLMIKDSELLSESMENRSACLISLDGSIYFGNFSTSIYLTKEDQEIIEINGINRSPKNNEITILTPSFGDMLNKNNNYLYTIIETKNLPIQINKTLVGKINEITNIKPKKIENNNIILICTGNKINYLKETLKENQTILLDFKLANIGNKTIVNDFSNIVQAISGGPCLLKNNKIIIDADFQKFSQNEFVNKKHPRTAIGVNKKNELILITIDGRSELSEGVSLKELAQILLKMQVTDAINLDGGGSTSMVIKGLYVNNLSDGFPRPIANALLIYYHNDTDPNAQTYDVQQNIEVVNIDQPKKEFKNLSSTKINLPENEIPLIWGTLDGKNFISQQGIFSPILECDGKFAVLTKNSKKYIFPYESVAK